MQGMTRPDRDLWDAGEVTGHLVPPGSVFAFLAEHRTELFPEQLHRGLVPVADRAPVAAGGPGWVGASAQGAV